MHLGTLALSLVYWLTMVIICDRALDCTQHWESIVNIAEDRFHDPEKLTYHKSISTIYAEELENQHIRKLQEDSCIINHNHTFYLIDVNGEPVKVKGKVEQLDEKGETIDSTEKLNGLDESGQTIDYNGQAYAYSSTETTTDHFIRGDTSSARPLCASLCIALPYQALGPDELPNALDWYSALRWWDMLLLLVAACIQFRLKSIEEGDGYGSYGPLVVDEKDIALTSIQLLSIIMSFFFYR